MHDCKVSSINCAEATKQNKPIYMQKSPEIPKGLPIKKAFIIIIQIIKAIDCALLHLTGTGNGHHVTYEEWSRGFDMSEAENISSQNRIWVVKWSQITSGKLGFIFLIYFLYLDPVNQGELS